MATVLRNNTIHIKSNEVNAAGISISNPVSRSAIRKRAERKLMYKKQRSEAISAMPSFRAKDPVSAITHFAGCLSAIIGTPFLLIHGSMCGAGRTTLATMGIFLMSMILLYGASASYHTFNVNDRASSVLKKLDHMSIFILIAGSYTPFCCAALSRREGIIVLSIVWGTAVFGMIFKFFWVTCPKWISSVMYIGMGWTCILVMPQFFRELGGWGMSAPDSASGIAGPLGSGFVWLLAGGIFYTIGGIIYAIKPNTSGLFRKFNRPTAVDSRMTNLDGVVFGNHELFHLFVMAGSLCHYTAMYITICNIG